MECYITCGPWTESGPRFNLRCSNQNEINNNKHSLRSNTKAYGGKTHKTDSRNNDTTASSGKELYHLQFSLQTASPETFGYTFVCLPENVMLHNDIQRVPLLQLANFLDFSCTRYVVFNNTFNTIFAAPNSHYGSHVHV
jgi:hypothetical protein